MTLVSIRTRRPSERESEEQKRAPQARQKLATDPVYAQVVRESRKKWREEHPDYQKRYWQEHPGAAERNRQQQHIRDQRRRLRHLVKNNLVPAQVLILSSVEGTRRA